jgi:DNA repair exonuclease SbcCD ATPase subunit
MHPTKLYLKNFLSFEEQEYTFEQGKAILIQGVNNTKKESQASNGSGKSSLQSAMEYCLTQNTSRKCRDIKLMRRGANNDTIVKSEIYCPIRKQTLVIDRKIQKKGSTLLFVSVNDVVEIDTGNGNSTVLEGNKFILNWLGITAEDLANYFIVNKERYTSFFSSSNTKKIELISRFSDTKKLDGIETFIQTDIDEIQAKITLKGNELISLQSKLEVYNQQLAEENNRDFEKEKESKINSIQSSIVELESDIISYKEKLIELNQQLTEQTVISTSIEENINSINTSIASISEDKLLIENLNSTKTKISDQEALIKEVNDIKKQQNEQLTSIDSNIRSIVVKLSGSVTCPNCSHEFLPSGKEDVKVLKTQKDTYLVSKNGYETDISESVSLLSELSTSLKEYETTLTSLKTEQSIADKKVQDMRNNLRIVERSLETQNNSIKTIKNNISNHENNIISSENSIKTYLQQIDQIKNSVFESKVKEIQNNIDIINTSIETTTQEKQTLENEKFEVSQWIFNFKKFKSFLAQKSLLVLQTKINENLKEMKSDLRLIIEGFKQKADGTIKEEITPIIYDNGEEVEFSELSGGERVRVDQATVLTCQSIINETHKYGGLDLIWADEITEGLDSLGLRLLMKSMPANKTILLTTHIAMDSLYENILTVENNNGISKIKTIC